MQSVETQRAWKHLHDVFAGLSTDPQIPDDSGDKGRCGVSVIAKSLNNMTSFLDVANEVIRAGIQLHLCPQI